MENNKSDSDITLIIERPPKEISKSYEKTYFIELERIPQVTDKELIFDKDLDNWKITLCRHHRFFRIKLEINNSYAYQKEYKFIFTLINLSNNKNFVSDGFKIFNSGTKSFSTGELEIFNTKDIVKILDVNEEQNKGFKLKVEIDARAIPMYDFINDIKNMIDNKYNRDILGEGYYEWNFDEKNKKYDEDYKNTYDNYKKNKKLTSPTFIIGSYNWCLEIQRNKNNENNENNINNENNENNKNNVNKLVLINNDVTDFDNSSCVCTKFVFVLREIEIENKIKKNYHESKFKYFTKEKNIQETKMYIDDSELKKISKGKEFVIGVYIRIYNNSNTKKCQYIDKLEKKIKNEMGIKNKTYEIIDEGFHEWEVYDWDEENDIDIRNPYFRIGNYKWYINYNDKLDDNILLTLNYDKGNHEDIYANYVFSIHKFNDYESIESVSNDFNYFSRENNYYDIKLQIDNEKWKEYTSNERFFFTVYVRIYREKGKIPKFRDLDRNLIKQILPNDKNLAEKLKKYGLLNIKTNEYVVVSEKDDNTGFSYGYKPGRSENIGLIPNSFINEIPESKE